MKSLDHRTGKSIAKSIGHFIGQYAVKCVDYMLMRIQLNQQKNLKIISTCESLVKFIDYNTGRNYINIQMNLQ